MFFNRSKDDPLVEGMEQFPTLLMEPWRVNELIEEEAVIQRRRLFRAIAWTRMGVALLALIVFFFYGHLDSVVTVVLLCYIIFIFALMLRGSQHPDGINRYSFLMAIFDLSLLSYFIVINDSKAEIGFLFLSVLLSAMLMPFGRLLIIVTLAALSIAIGSMKSVINQFYWPFSAQNWWDILQTQSHLFLPSENLQAILAMVIGIFVTAVVANRLASWSFRNEVKAQFRYKQVRHVLSFNRSIIEHLKSGVLVLTADAKIISINQRAIELLNLSSTQAIIHLRDLSIDLARRYQHWLSSGIEAPMPYRHNEGAQEVSVSFSGFGQAEQRSVVMMNLESVNESLQQAQEAKLQSLGRLTAGVAHEIRNPLSSISSAAQLLGETAENPQQKKLTNMIVTNVKRTNQIISDILGLFKETQSRRELLSVNETLTQFCQDFSLANSERRFEIYVTGEKDLSLYFMFDAGQFDQVLWNLAQNALKYAGVDNLIITLQYQLAPSRKNIYIDVIDNGKGIPAEKIPHIFEPFYTGGTSGSGLGLYLVRELCSANNANIVFMPFEGDDAFGARFRIVTQTFFSKNTKPKAG